MTHAIASTQIGADGGGIAYSKGDGHIWVVNANGRGAHRVTSSPSARDVDPSWSPDGRQIVFKSVPATSGPKSRASAIVVVNIDGSGRRVVSPAQDVESPSWSPDGTLIAFQLKGHIALVRPDGRELRVLPVDGGCPSWAPDSDVIAICGDDGNIYAIGRDGSVRRRLTRAGGPDEPGPWSHDGTHLSFLRHGNIYVMNADGSHQKRVTNFPGTEAPNAWLKSGEIIFPLYRGSTAARWFEVRANGQGLQRLSQLRIAFDPLDWHER